MTASETFTVGPLSSGIEAAALSEWLADTSGSPSIVYAQGLVPPRTLAVWQMAQEYMRCGLVELAARKVDGGWHWVAQRKRNLPKSSAAPVATPAPDAVTTNGDTVGEAILKLVKRAANLGLACPSLAGMAKAGELKDAHAARYQLQKLVDRGFLRVDNLSDGKRRIFVLGPTGGIIKATGFSVPSSGRKAGVN